MIILITVLPLVQLARKLTAWRHFVYTIDGCSVFSND